MAVTAATAAAEASVPVPVVPVEGRIELQNGVVIATRDWSDSDACRSPTANNKVLCLHGFLDNAATFDVLLPLLQRAHPGRWHFVAMDFAGHGHSTHRSRDSFYSRATHTLDAIEVADRLGWRTFVVMGHSMGANVATSLAASFPSRVLSLVLLDGVAQLASVQSSPVQLARLYTEQQKRLNGRTARVHATRDAVIEHYRASVGHAISVASAARLIDRGTVRAPVPPPRTPVPQAVATAGVAATTASSDAKHRHTWASASGGAAATATASVDAKASALVAAPAPGVSAPASALGWAFRHDPRIVPGFFTPIWTSRQEIDDLLAAVRCPALCVMVSNDARRTELAAPPQPGALNWIHTIFGYTKQLTRGVLVVVDDATHHAHMDKADVCAPLVVRWLADDAHWQLHLPTPPQPPQGLKAKL